MKTALQLSIIVLYIFPFNVCKGTTCSSLGGVVPVPVPNSPYTILENGSLCCDPYTGPRTCIEAEPGKDLQDVVKELECKGGLVYEPCHFCRTCAKVAGELCGGIQSEYGRCDEGLVCLNGTKAIDGSNGIGTCYHEATKLLGEVCGGPFGRLGRCTAGLICNVSDTSAHDVQGVCLAKLAGETCGEGHSEFYSVCDEGLVCLNGTEVMDGSNGIGTCYYKATKGLGEVCGGAYGSLGRCTAGHRCNVSDTSANDEHGVCLDENALGACFKNCIERESMELCGNDGRRYRNRCELRKQNCLIPPGRQPYRVKSTDKSVCEQACGDVELKHEQATVNYTNGVRNGSIAAIGCKTGYKLHPASVTLVCLNVVSGDSTSGQWHRQVEYQDGSVELSTDYFYSCAQIQSPSDISDSSNTDQQY